MRKDRKIWLPVLMVVFAGFQIIGIDAGRAVASSIRRDTTAVTAPIDSFASPRDSFAGVGDSVEIVNPRDTIRIPDSLEFKDPFKYKYYIALRDTATWRATRDSVLASGDSLELHRLDSLHFKDSSEIAKIKFDAWYRSLSRRERKKYDYEQKLPALLRREDSIMHRKDSIKAYKDSVRENTPRILETFAFPDSMQYKRLVNYTLDQDFQQIKFYVQDTSYNCWYHEMPQFRNDVNITWQGVDGSAVQTYDFFKREEVDNAIFYTPYKDYSYSASTFPMYNTKTPYTELAYWGTIFAKDEKEETNVRVWTSQNILPELNLTLAYYKYGGNGILQREDVSNGNAVVGLTYLGRKYMMHSGYVYNKIVKSENGGVTDVAMIRDTTLDAKELAVNLHKAANTIKKHTFFVDQTFRIPFTFINKIKAKKDSTFTFSADSLDKDITTAYIGHSTNLDVYSKKYTDEITGSNPEAARFYNNAFYLNPTKSADSLGTLRLDNKVFFRMQPWSADAPLSKIDVGIGDKLATYYDFNRNAFLSGKVDSRVLNSVYVYAGLNGRVKKYMEWDVTGKYNFAGYEVNDFSVKANLRFSFFPFRRDKSSPVKLNVNFETNLKEPDWYQQHLLINHYNWDNDFSKVSTTKVLGELDIPRWEMKASFGYALLANQIYYDNTGTVRQAPAPVNVMTAYLKKNFTLWRFHLDNQAIFQLSSDEQVLPLPMLGLNLRWYLQFPVVKNVMEMQIGLNGYFTTSWYAQGYNPALGVFYNQNEIKYGNCPYYDVFVNVQWYKACIFLKFMNAGQGWPMKSADYFTAHGNIYTQRAFKVGIYWPFYIGSNKNKKASSGGGGSGAGGRGGSGGGRGGSGGGRGGSGGGSQFGGLGGIKGLN